MISKSTQSELIALKERRNEIKARLYSLEKIRYGLELDKQALAVEIRVNKSKLADVEIDIDTVESELKD